MNHAQSTSPALKLGLMSTLASCVAIFAVSAQAQTAGAEGAGPQREELVITARRREENLNEVPVAIAAFTADDIAKRNIESLVDVAKYTAGFSFENFAGGQTPAPIIRGLTQNTLTDRNQNVGTFVNGVHIQQQGNIDFNLLPIERIEVLRGPQNSQYGRSSFAGAINYVPIQPDTQELNADVQLTAGTDERLEARANVNFPIIEDMLALQVYGAITEYDGAWKNNFSAGDTGIPVTDASFGQSFDGTDGNLGGWDNEAFQLQLRFEPSDNLTIDLSHYDSEVNNEQSAIQFVRPQSVSVYGLERETNCNPSNATGLFRFYCGELDLSPGSITVDPRSVGLTAETELTTFRLDWDITEDVNFTYLGGWNDLKSNGFSHSSNPPNPEFEGCGFFAGGTPPCGPGLTGVLFVTGPTEQDARSHEFRLSGQGLGSWTDAVRWTAGFYTSEVEDGTFINSVEQRRSVIEDPTGQIVVLPFAVAEARFKDETEAFFGNISYDFSDIYTLDVEARYSVETRSSSSSGLPAENFYSFTPRVNLKAQLNEDTMVYGSVAKGSKAGGFNTPSADPGFETFDEETNITYELGAKQTLLDGSLQLNSALFYVDWSDLQLPTADLIPSNPPATDANFISNLSGAESYGIELEGAYFIGDHWTVNFAASYTETEFDSDALDFGIGAQCADSSDPVCESVTVGAANASPIGGNELPRQPPLQLAAGLEYAGNFGNWSYFARGRRELSGRAVPYRFEPGQSSIPDAAGPQLHGDVAGPGLECVGMGQERHRRRVHL